mmetsp:Transcript_4179/g.6538  ORF Transcript_4179/g.6538 Transcript_4179/m.6538 type:complete len:271 (+) Transcript_4179:181-993(+)
MFGHVLHVINLDRRPERFQTFCQRCDKRLWKKIVRISATDGEQEVKKARPDTEDWFGKFLHLNRNLRQSGKATFSVGEIGCFVSHITLWEKAVHQQKLLVVLEDDTQFSENFFTVLHSVLLCQEKLEAHKAIVYLGGRSQKDFVTESEYLVPSPELTDQFSDIFSKQKPEGNDQDPPSLRRIKKTGRDHELKIAQNTDRTTHAYVISSSAAKFLLQSLQDQIEGKSVAFKYLPVDHFMKRCLLQNDQCHVMTMVPLPSFATDEHSDIRRS